MDRLEKFDEGLKRINAYDSLLNNMVKYIYSVMWVFVLTVMVMELGNFHFIYRLNFFLWSTMIPVCVLNPFLYIKSNGVRVSVFEALKDVPIDREVFKNSRIKRLVRYEVKFFVWCVVVRMVIMLLFTELSLDSIIKSVICLVVAAVTMHVSGIIYINCSMKR